MENKICALKRQVSRVPGSAKTGLLAGKAEGNLKGYILLDWMWMACS